LRRRASSTTHRSVAASRFRPARAAVIVPGVPDPTAAPALHAVYVDLDGTLLGPRAGLFQGEDGAWSWAAVEALEACHRAGAEVVLLSGRARTLAAEDARVLGLRSFICEAGACVVLDGTPRWLTGRFQPSAAGGTVFAQVAATGAPDLLLERFRGRLEPHEPWSRGRDVSHLLRGLVDVRAAGALLLEHGHGDLHLLDNGAIDAVGTTLDALPEVHAYHLLPRPASKAAAVAAHRDARGFDRARCLAVGDSPEDLAVAPEVGEMWLVANALERDRGLGELLRAHPDVRVARGRWGAGVREAVLAGLRADRTGEDGSPSA
jgi:hypothetical protein